MSSMMQNMNPSRLRIDYSTVDRYSRPAAPKLSFWQKLGRGVGKFMSFAGPIGAAVTAIALPGIGLPIAAGLYGLTRVSQDQLYKAQVKDQINAQHHQQQQAPVGLPGLFQTTPLDAGEKITDFIVPSELNSAVGRLVIQREDLHQSEINQFRR